MEQDKYLLYCKAARKHLEYYMTPHITAHLVDVTASVMMHRDMERPGGSTVKAICDNDLLGTVSRADLDVMRNLAVIVAAYHYAHIEEMEHV